MMKKDPTEWRKKFDAWKNGTPTSELFNLPKYDDGTDDNQPVVKYYTEKDLDKLFDTYNAPFVKDSNIVPFDQNDWNSSKNDPEMRKDLTEWVNELMTDNKVSVDGGELGNVVVTPTKQDKKILRLFKKAIPNKQIRNTIYEDLDIEDEFQTLANKTLSQNEKVRNIVSIWQMSGNPSTYNGILDFFTRYPGTSDRRPNYNIWNNSIGNIGFNDDLGVLDDYLAELSHAYQFSKYAPKKIRENQLTRFLSLPGDIKIDGKDGYNRPGNLEYNAHSIIEPAIRDYIQYEKYPSVQSLNDRIELVNPKKHDKGKSIKPLPKCDGGTGDKTYLPEYEYEATVTPQGTSLEKHKRITNEEDWQKYWGNVGAGYVNQAQESVAVPTLKTLKELTYFTPIGAATSLGDAIAAHMNGGSPEEILSATVGALPEVRFANNIGRFSRYANLADDMIQINPQFLQTLQEGDFVTKRRFGSAALGKIEDALRNYKTFLRQGYTNVKRQLLGTAVKNRKILPKQVQKIVDDQIDNQHLKEYWSGPFAFNSFEYRPGDMTSLSYFNMTPKQVMSQAMQDMNDIPVGSRFLVNSLSTDSYPLVIHMLDSKISPNFKLNPVTDRIVLNGMGNLHGQAAVDRINKKLQQLEMQSGMSLGRAKRYMSPIGEEQITAPFLTAERLYDKGKSIHINPANKGKFNATKKRTGKTTEQLAHSKNPLTRKRAVFALNSRKFKH